jgi:hypothetical protein
MWDQGRRLGWFVVFVAGVGACSSNEAERVGHQREAIINGTPLPLPVGRHVFIHTVDGLLVSGPGSGTVLNENWVLTAAHVVRDAPSPDKIQILTDSSADLPPRKALEIRIHPLYLAGSPDGRVNADTDVALVRVDRPFENVVPVTVSNANTEDLLGGQVTCFGYGRNQRGVSPNVLDPVTDPPPLLSAEFTVADAGEIQLRRQLFMVRKNGSDQIIAPGDSGGGCFMGTPGGEVLVGVNKFVTHTGPDCRSNDDCPLNDIGGTGRCVFDQGSATIGRCDSDLQPVGYMQAAESFVGFVRAVTRAPATGSLASAGSQDRVTLNVAADNTFEFLVEYEDGQSFVVKTPIVDAGTGTIVQTELNDVDGDNLDDLMVLIQGRPPGTSQTRTLGFLASSKFLGSPPDWTKLATASFLEGSSIYVPVPLNTVAATRADLNGDGLSDIVTVSDEGNQRFLFGHNTSGLVRSAALAYATPDLNNDGTKDLVLANDVGGQIQLNWRLSTGASNVGNTTIAVDEDLPIALVAGNFNQDAKGEDHVLMADGSLAYYEANGGGTAPFKRFLHDSAAEVTDAVRLSTLNGLGSGPDIEAVLADANSTSLKVFRGSGSGLTTSGSSVMYGMPSEDAEDGKLLTISGEGQRTVAEPRSTLKLAFTNTLADVQIFDGNFAGVHDLPDNAPETCFQLWSDPCGDGLGECMSGATPALVGTPRLGSQLADDQWAVLYRGPHVGPASPSGAHIYRLESFLSKNGNCNVAFTDIDGEVDASRPGWNGFKVRSNGQVSALFGELTVIGADFDTELGTPGLSWTRDTNYDGVFSFVFEVGGAAQGIGLKEADADDLEDETAGRAEGANIGIGHGLYSDALGDFQELDRVENGELTPVGDIWVDNASGNFDSGGTDRDLEAYRLSPPNIMPGFYVWYWDNVWVQNNLHVFAPEGSPVTYELLAPASLVTGQGRVTPSSASLRADWVNATTSSLLPIVLGSLENGTPAGSSVLVSSSSSARAILLTTSTPLDQVRGELLAAKLNIARAAGAGELLSSALLYGVATSVRATLAEADALVRGPAVLQAPADVDRVLKRLRAINAAQVTYFRPGVPYPSAPGDDDDGDGVLNVKDNCPPIANADQLDSDADLVGDACRVVPRVSCVMELASGKLRAYFGYESPLSYRSIPPGVRNRFTTGAPDRGQPLEFVGGEQPRAFAVEIAAGSSLTWNLEDTSVTASASSPRCSGNELTTLPFAKDVALFAKETLTLSDSATVRLGNGWANVVSGGKTELGALSHTGSVLSRGNTWLRSNAVVTGNLVTGGTVDKQPSASVSGLTVQNSYVAPHELDFRPTFPPSTGDVRLEPNTSRSITPGSFGEVNLKNGAVLTLRAGKYFFRSLLLEAGSKIVLADPEAVTVYVDAALTHRGTIVAAGGGDPQLFLGYFGQNSAFIESSFAGTVLAPKAELVLGGSASTTFRGVFFAQRVLVRAGVTIAFDPLD